ncbi:MAG: hypothetical protein ACRDI2_15155 [Chloroflexota bacterium]
MAVTAEIRLVATVGEDRRLEVQLPVDAPTGPVELTIRAAPDAAGNLTSPESPARAAARAKMLAAGFLSDAHHPPPGASALPIEERVRLGTMPPGTRPSEELIAEDRGAY